MFVQGGFLCALLLSLSSLTNSFSPAHRPLVVKTIGPAFDGNPSHYDNRARKDTALMGIPKMFRWLTDQYPNIMNSRLTEGLSPDVDVDSFYLDMNGIIHPCTHGNAEGEIIYLDETAMYKKIFLYVDRLYKMVQPSKVLYLAVDGVAPRAKMNQQRSRRFRSAKEAEQTVSEIVAREQYLGEQSKTSDKNRFDSNCITPGTDFMLKLSLALQKWVEYKIDTDPFWKDGAQVIVSGPDVPGEGEHKVMDFIRDEREKYEKGDKTDLYAPGWTHVLFGLDADLIMLGLVTHEPKFMLLREKMAVVMAGRGRNKFRKKKDMLEYDRHDYELLELSALRQMLAFQFEDAVENIKGFSLERIIDDFVFMCMLVGNDFLPHMPHMEIDGGAISLVLTNYMELLPEWGDFLTDKEKIHPRRFEQFVYHLSAVEEDHFKRRGYEENEPGWKLSTEHEADKNDFYGTFYSGKPTPEAAVYACKRGAEPPPSKIDSKAVATIRERLDEQSDSPTNRNANRAFRRAHPGDLSRSYRDFYYNSKLGWPVEDRERTLFQRRAHVRDYLEGLHWNLFYYHRGCASWDWYFPHLYSPLATDMVNLDEFYDDFREGDSEFVSFTFDKGTPFPSLGQLLSVLPPQSAGLLPKALGELMLEPSSPIIHFYPADFEADPNGKRQAWEAVVKVPFIDADLLLETLNHVLDADEKKGDILTPAERRRNILGKDHIFVPPGFSSEKVQPNGASPSGERKGPRGATSGRSGISEVNSTRKGKSKKKGKKKSKKKSVARQNR